MDYSLVMMLEEMMEILREKLASRMDRQMAHWMSPRLEKMKVQLEKLTVSWMVFSKDLWKDFVLVLFLLVETMEMQFEE